MLAPQCAVKQFPTVRRSTFLNRIRENINLHEISAIYTCAEGAGEEVEPEWKFVSPLLKMPQTLRNYVEEEMKLPRCISIVEIIQFDFIVR